MTLGETALLLLSSGRSTRFERGDKLLANLSGKPVLSYAASSLAADPVNCRIAIVGDNQAERKGLLVDHGWTVLLNPDPDAGQGQSLKIGLQHIEQYSNAQAMMILLADMPMVPDQHLYELADTLADGTQAVMSEANGNLGPPAIFARSAFALLHKVSGDTGARKVFRQLERTKTVPVETAFTLDIDRDCDIRTAEDLLND